MRKKQYERLKECAVAFYKDIFLFAYKHTGDEHSAQDIAQIVMERAIVRSSQLKDLAALKPWLMQIAANEIHTYFRNLQRYEKHHVGQADSEDGQTGAPENIEDDVDILNELIEREEGGQAVLALRQLDERYQQVLRLSLVCEYSFPEIANILGLNYHTVKTRFSRGAVLLRREYEHLEKGGAENGR